MKTITYNLAKEQQDSTLFYKELESYSDLLIEYSRYKIEEIVFDYKIFLLANKIEKIRSYEEYLYDILSFAVYYKIYFANAQSASVAIIKLAKKLYTLRSKNKNLKKYIDPVRGFIASAFLIKYKLHYQKSTEYSTEKIHKFIEWLEATGEFREEVKRFYNVENFLLSLKPNEKSNFFSSTFEIADWFEKSSSYFLGDYTVNVKNFLEEEHPSHKWKEDYIFCGRKAVEYHLGIVGAELMNRAFKSEYEETEDKAVLLPACMRAKQDDCKAIKLGLDLKCTHCTKNCRVNEISRVGIQNNFSVHIIPHSSDFTKWLETLAAGKNVGVIGVACPLNLITGGLELKSLNIPAQCVFLDYCGCKNHWDKKGFATNINIDKLLETTSSKKQVTVQTF